MVEINTNDRTATIKVESCSVENLMGMQLALIDLLRSYNYRDFGLEAGETVFNGLTLLEAMMPNHDQQKRGFIKETDYVELPENMNKQQRNALNEALFHIANPDMKMRKDRNQVFEALKNIEK